jgi:NADPH:quinone reductase-like Zn-dependent oxidoreductase
MKAVVCTEYGSFENIRVEEVPKPAPADNEVLINVKAASINFNALAFVKGKPFMVRLTGGGILKPKHKIPGNDIAGCVEAVGGNVKQFQPGDEVFGDICKYGWGAFAEYVSVPEKALALKPANISWEEAAAVPEAALVTLQALRDKGRIKKGQKVLINGASGGIGTFAMQIAKYFGAEVTGVCSTGNLDLVRSLGADHVIDYTKEDFTQNGQRYDLILATAGYRSIFDYKRALNPGGIYVATGGAMSGHKAMAQIFEAIFIGPWISMFGSRKLGISMVQPNKDLTFMKELIEAGKVKPVIDKRFPLSEAAKALKYYAGGHAKGKVVLTMEHKK